MLTTFGWTLLVAAVLMGRAAVKTRQSSARDIPAELRAETAAARGGVVNQIRAIEVQFLEQTRQLQAELDSRRLILDRLIAEADERIADLEGRIDVAGRVGFDDDREPLRRAA